MFGGLELSTRIHAFHRTFRSRSLTGSGSMTTMRIMMLFIRLRAVLFELCPEHPVALCETCRRAYTPEELGTGVGKGCYLCGQCGTDLRASLTAHARTCPNLTPQKPLARMTSVTRPMIPPAASERFMQRHHRFISKGGSLMQGG